MSTWQEMNWKAKSLAYAAIFLAFSLIVFLIWYGNWVYYVPNGHMPYTFDKMTGKVEVYPHNGWIVVTPWEKDVHEIDIRPSQVCMNANQRVLNCKLVRFNPYDVSGTDTKSLDGFNKFIEWHGVSAGDRGYVYEILKSYAFNVNDGRDCPFLKILDDMRHKGPPTDTSQGVGK